MYLSCNISKRAVPDFCFSYRIIFGIVRLAGLYELVASKTCKEGVRLMNTLYDQLNDHLTGAHKRPTDAFRFVAKITAEAEWVGGPPKSHHDQFSVTAHS